jgi:hypothetical protein
MQMARKRYVFTAHAVAVMGERRIQRAWAERVMDGPTLLLDDKRDPSLKHALGRIVERDARVLRVVYNDRTEPWRVVTVYFDRSVRDEL